MLKVARWLLIILGLLGALFLAFFYRSDLSRAELAEYVSPASEFLALPMGANVHYRDEGNPNGPALVMLHGGFGSLHNWEVWVPHLADKYRLISMDLPAHGLTGRIKGDVYTRAKMVQLVRELLDALDVERFSLAGHSMGGGVALAYALAFPDQIESIVLVGSEGVPPPGGYELEGTFFEDYTARERILADTSLSFTERFLTKLASPWAVGAALRSIVGDGQLVADEAGARFGRILRHEGNRQAIVLMFRQSLAAMDTNEDLAPRMGEISAPVLILHGEVDSLVPMVVGDRFHHLIDDSEMKVYENVGHMIMMERPERTAADVDAFLSRRALRGSG